MCSSDLTINNAGILRDGLLVKEKDGAVMQGERFVMNVLLGGSDELANLISTGVEVVDYRSDRVAEVVVDREDLVGLANLNFVEWIEPKYSVQLDNEAAAGIIDVDWVGDSSNMASFGGSLTGAGVIVGVMDSGLDTAVLLDDGGEN